MKSIIEISAERNFITWTMEGLLTAKEILGDYERILKLDECNPELNLLVTFTASTMLGNLDMSEMEKLASELDKVDTAYREGQEFRVALITSERLHEPILEIWEHLAKPILSSTDKIFTDKQSAEQWLASVPYEKPDEREVFLESGF